MVTLNIAQRGSNFVKIKYFTVFHQSTTSGNQELWGQGQSVYILDQWLENAGHKNAEPLCSSHWECLLC
jgi:hypothetical protein